MNPSNPIPAFPAADIEALLARHHTDPHALVQILRELQALHGWVPRQNLTQIAQTLGLTLAHVEGVAGFYRFIHMQPVGSYRILFSDNVTDRMLGSEEMLRHLCHLLNVAPGRRASMAGSAWPPRRAPGCVIKGRRCWSITIRW